MAPLRALLRGKCFLSPKEGYVAILPSSLRLSVRRFQRTDVVDREIPPPSKEGRTLADILYKLNQKITENHIKTRKEDGFTTRYLAWHTVNRMMNSYAQEWSGEVRSITYSNDGKSVSVVYRVTIYGADAEIYRESTGTASVNEKSIGDPVQKAEAMAFRRACARFGLGLHLYHEDAE